MKSFDVVTFDAAKCKRELADFRHLLDREAADRRRLRWREERVVVNSHPIHCLTFDELHDELNKRLTLYERANPERKSD